ncbi:hypothetical protein POM88_026582 [Heracleum sosnowskyi]|uniref:Transposase-associated domain-containing protein n=1 Tax=Heracleum sosnowskyi TaxID=360622 RepID=A0AAD8I6U3_9APIA|nr:hypothetical protein POM88_026582 [Heracleum sosnowskyi]
MSFNRSWTNQCFHVGTNCYTREFLNGVDEFLKFAKRHCKEDDEEVKCLCFRCCNVPLKSFEEVRFEILTYGFCEYYTFWDVHGDGGREPYASSSRNIANDCDDVHGDGTINVGGRVGGSHDSGGKRGGAINVGGGVGGGHRGGAINVGGGVGVSHRGGTINVGGHAGGSHSGDGGLGGSREGGNRFLSRGGRRGGSVHVSEPTSGRGNRRDYA